MFNNIGFSEFFIYLIWLLITMFFAWCVIDSIKTRKTCKHERFKLIHSETNYTKDLYEVKVNHYRCLGCGFIKKDESKSYEK